MLNGIDIYAGSGPIEWHKVAEAGTAFCFVRGVYGTAADKAAAPNVAAARAVGMKTGLYHFFRARMDPAAQTQAMLAAMDACKIGAGDLPPVLDVEDNPNYDGPWNNADNPAYIAALRSWVQTMKDRVGRAPIIYTRASFWAQLGNPAGFSDCTLWVASYRDDAPTMPTGWPSPYQFWQYSESGTVAGISGHVDMNYFNVSVQPRHL
ncbi:glycoside hydrolase family 25 protein [Pseudoduganella namucuonensis]|uniref:Lysozyme n=1 Tax=Pseudoduganella namucuonensis TaxID=1035707 RepID=A0A1I7LEA3_9BURK|nr:glycoside hydrolase family 25 protein [Pseudoduganella namucuonensis]SFV08021.1 lysozyme [Pseudoduganella namucuonensis]